MSLLNIPPYISWKVSSTNSVVPSFSRPDLNSSGPNFKANPIRHWRKQLIPTSTTGTNSRSNISMPINTPGGSVYLGNVKDNTSCLLSTAGINSAKVLENIEKYDNTDFKNMDGDSFYDTENNKMACVACNPEVKQIKRATTILSKKYYSDTKGYMRSRCVLYDQKLTANPIVGINYFEADGQTLLLPSDSPTGPQVRQSQNCTTNCNTNTSCTTIYKPNNTQFMQQGAVDSSSRIARLKLNTVNKNAVSYKDTFGTTASKYMGMSSTPYFLKSKYQKCVPMGLTGQKTICV